MIKLIIFDIDGIITDDTVMIDDTGREQKRMNFKDVDAVYELHRLGYQLAAITGEGNQMAEYFRNRFPWDYFYSNNKRKRETVEKLCAEIQMPLEQICFIGEGKYDVEVLSYVGLGVCPSDAIDRAREQSDIILKNRGGDGCVWELIQVLEQYNQSDEPQSCLMDQFIERGECYKKMAADQELIRSVMHMGRMIKDLLQKKKQVFLCGYEDNAVTAKYMAFGLAETIVLSGDRAAEQLKEKAKQGDLLILLFTGSITPAILDVLRYAYRTGLMTAAFTGNEEHFEGDDIVSCQVRTPAGKPSLMREARLAVWNQMIEISKQI